MEEQAPLEVGKIRVIDLTTNTPRKDLTYYKAFSIAYKDKDGKVWDGSFVVKRLTIGDVSRLGVLAASRDGGLTNIPSDIRNINQMVAHLEVALVDRPAWFKPDELYDQGLVSQIYDEVAKFETTFR